MANRLDQSRQDWTCGGTRTPERNLLAFSSSFSSTAAISSTGWTAVLNNNTINGSNFFPLANRFSHSYCLVFMFNFTGVMMRHPFLNHVTASLSSLFIL